MFLAWEMNRELHCWARKDFLTMFFFPLGIAVLVSIAINLRYMPTHIKKYSQRMILGLVAYMLGIGLVNRIQVSQSPYKYLLVLLPILPIIYVSFAIIRVVSEMDELKRKISTEAMAFSGLATGFSSVSYIFLRDAGAPEFPLSYAFYLMWIYYFIGFFFSKRRYQ